MKKFFLAAFDDLMAAFSRALPDPPWSGIIAVLVGFVSCWWLYVPVHELFHAGGCIATGGTVERLEIDPQYGAALLHKVFPFVAVGSEYAGQLAGFDTHGNDLIYLATVFAPFLLTILIGVPLLRGVARRGRPGPMSSLWLGVAAPVAFAPFTNVIGDYYEMGSILVSRGAVRFGSGVPLERWRSDDLIKTARELLFSGSFQFVDLAGLLLGFLLGAFLAFLTYRVGDALADLVFERSGSGR